MSTGKAKKEQTKNGCIGCLGVIVVIAFFIWIGSDSDNDSGQSQQANTQQAEQQAKEREKQQEIIEENKRIIQETVDKYRENGLLKKIDRPDRTYYLNYTMWRLINAEQKEQVVTWLARHSGYFYSEINEAGGITVKDWQSGKTIAEYSVWSGVSIE